MIKNICYKLTQILLISSMLLSVSCLKILKKIGEEDPCMRAYFERQKLKKTVDRFELQQIKLQIEVEDKLCRDRNASLNKGSH